MNSDEPLVTIMIPTYGQASIVHIAIESALAQDYPSLEVLIVDDASPDATQEVLSRYSSDPRVNVIRHEHNRGRVSTYRHSLFELARGELVLNLDGDDWLCDPTYISAAVDQFRRYPGLAVVFAKLKILDEATGLIEEQPAEWSIPTPCDGNEIFQLYAKGGVIQHPTAVYRRDAAVSVGFYEYNVIGSDSISFLCLLPGRSAVFVDHSVAVWRSHGDNASLLTSAMDLIANFAVADVPAGRTEVREALGSTALREWHRAMSAQLGYRALADKFAARQVATAMRVGFFMLRTRPRALVSALGLLASGAIRYLRHHEDIPVCSRVRR